MCRLPVTIWTHQNRTMKILAEARSRTSTDAPQGLIEAYVDYKTTTGTSQVHTPTESRRLPQAP